MLYRYLNRLQQLSLPSLLLLAAILLLPALFSGLITDDWIHYSVFHSKLGIGGKDFPSIFGVFSFLSSNSEHYQNTINFGQAAWWADEDFSWVFFRPLTEISHYIDYVLFSGNEIIMHLHSMLLYLLFCFGLYHCLQKVFSPPQSQLILLVFAFSNVHALTVTWVANRGALLAGLFCLLAFYQYTKVCNGKKFYALALLSFILALASGEIALSLGVFLGFYVWFVERKPLHLVVWRLMPFLIIAVLWAAFYTSQGLGLKGASHNYIDFTRDPIRYLTAFPGRFIGLLWGLLTPLPSDMVYQLRGNIYFYGISAMLLVTLSWLSYRLHILKVSCALFAIVFLCSIPVLSHIPEDRNLLFVSIASSIFIALLLQKAITLKAQILAKSLIVIHLIIMPLTIPFISYAPKIIAANHKQQAKSISQLEGKNFLVFGGQGLPFLVPSMLYYYQKTPAIFMRLSSVEPSKIAAKANNQVVINFDNSILGNPLDINLQTLSLRPLQQGKTYKVNNLSIKVLELAEKGIPKTLLLTLPKPYQSYQFITWKNQQPQVLMVKDETLEAH